MRAYDAWLNTNELSKKRWLKAIQVEGACSELVRGRAISELERAFGLVNPEDGCWSLYLSVEPDHDDLKGQMTGTFQISRQADSIYIRAVDDSGLIAAIYALVKKALLDGLDAELDFTHVPATSLRMVNHWDNMDGSIERGYSGRSFFFKDREIVLNDRTADYCRLAASVGINAIVINNVNVKDEATYLITDKHVDRLRKMSELFHSFGIQLFLSLNYAAPVELGSLDTADPLDEAVIKWWDERFAEVFRNLPLLGGFLVKADSEGRPGPFTYGRNQAEGANLLGRALKPFGKALIWRAFVYNAQQDWRDLKTDRARAAFDYFAPLDGQFLDNVYLQIKNGPMDFQVREPVSPLFSQMTKTNLILELQIAQEYTGQQIDLCYLGTQWREILDFKTGNPAVNLDASSLAHMIGDQSIPGVNFGIAAVSNTGDDENWFGNDLAALNYYAYGLLASDPHMNSREMAMQWVALTFGLEGMDDLMLMLEESWSVYEAYTAPLGIGWMVTPHTHYGPSVDGYEYDRWGTYHKADHKAIGVDRTDEGTGYAKLYPAVVGDVFNSKDSCPDEFVLFYHRMDYTDRLKSGKTLIQHIYDSRFWGYEEVEGFIRRWDALEGLVEDARHKRIRARFWRQLQNAREWRDQVNSYFWRKTGIADEKGRTLY